MDAANRSREPIVLRVEYADLEALMADYRDNISRGEAFVVTDRELPAGSQVRLMLAFPSLLKPVTLTGTITGVRAELERGVRVACDLGDPGRLHTLMDRIAHRDPELVGKLIRVLLVEDNPHVATLIQDGLTGCGKRELGGRVAFQFTMATNGVEALDILRRSHAFELLLVDIYLPVLDGIHIIKEIRANPELRHLTIVAVSAGGVSAKEDALSAGADAFLDKPMRLADIMQVTLPLIASK